MHGHLRGPTVREGNYRTDMIEANRSIIFSDDAIRRFLLGELTVTEQTAFENRLVADDELEARVRLSELGLADDYVQRRLTRAESLRVQARFLVTRDRQHMTAVSQALHDRFTPATHRSAQGFFNLDNAAWRYAFAAAILIIVFAAVWLGVKERRLAGPVPRAPPPFPGDTRRRWKGRFLRQAAPPRFRKGRQTSAAT